MWYTAIWQIFPHKLLVWHGILLRRKFKATLWKTGFSIRKQSPNFQSWQFQQSNFWNWEIPLNHTHLFARLLWVPKIGRLLTFKLSPYSVLVRMLFSHTVINYLTSLTSKSVVQYSSDDLRRFQMLCCFFVVHTAITARTLYDSRYFLFIVKGSIMDYRDYVQSLRWKMSKFMTLIPRDYSRTT